MLLKDAMVTRLCAYTFRGHPRQVKFMFVFPKVCQIICQISLIVITKYRLDILVIYSDSFDGCSLRLAKTGLDRLIIWRPFQRESGKFYPCSGVDIHQGWHIG